MILELTRVGNPVEGCEVWKQSKEARHFAVEMPRLWGLGSVLGLLTFRKHHQGGVTAVVLVTTPEAVPEKSTAAPPL